MRYMRAVLIALAVVGCANDVTSPAPSVEGLAFNYSGGMSGTFSANGEPDTTGTRAWAGAWEIEGTPLLILSALLPRTATTHDVVGILVPRTTPGTSTIATICPPEGCADLFVTFGRQNGGNDYLQGCHIVSGTVTIATISEARVTGSFTGTGVCFNNAGGESTFNVTSGAFDVVNRTNDVTDGPLVSIIRP
jgi:hypothetical protein